ncbi:MAG: FAD-dependent oxidoreductase, partial [Chloroflexota bacterium]|nr:FAD-dependent oxidoreductase [Chloroflexota bacterium]
MNDVLSYQVIIIGGGPAGLTAGLYTTRAGLKSLLVEKVTTGGQITSSEWVENYPGFPEGISGFELGNLMQQQAAKYGLEILMAEVKRIELAENKKVVKTGEGNFAAEAVIIAGGTEHAKLNVPGEESLVGRGLSFCATCDGPFFRDRAVAVIGGGDVAIADALFLTRFASKVFVIHRRDQLRATRILQNRAFSEDKIEFIWDTVVDTIDGTDSVSGLHLRNVKTSKKSALDVSGVFMAVGNTPNTDYLTKIIKLG